MSPEWPFLTLIVVLPLLGAAAVLLMPRALSRYVQLVGIAAAFPPLLLAAWIYGNYSLLPGSAPFREQAVWIRIPLPYDTFTSAASFALDLQYHLAIDGLSLPLVLLTAVVAASAALGSIYIKKRVKTFYSSFLIVESGLFGALLARDVILFIVFLEITAAAMFFLIGIWGSANRERSARRYLLANGAGSALLLLAFTLMVAAAGLSIEQTEQGTQLTYSGSYDVIAGHLSASGPYANFSDGMSGVPQPLQLTEPLRWTIFLLVLAGFGLSMPVFPFHSWMIKAHEEAASPAAMLLSGALLQVGGYGLLRYGVALFPEQLGQAGTWVAFAGIVQLFYGGLLALIQRDLRRLLAYASFSQTGLVLLGIASMDEIGLQGAVFQLVSQGLIMTLLFLIAAGLQERTGTVQLSELGGLARPLPFMCGILLAAALAYAGVPGLAGFPGKLLPLLGLFGVMKGAAAAAVAGIIVCAVCMLRGVTSVSYGAVAEKNAALKDARFIEAVPMIALLALVVLLGLYPSTVTDVMQHAFDGLLDQVNAKVEG
ncbi:complex I subunit 4 family protein [Paenibacillus beijingensis]|uniref:NADH:ubiquinone oxidoreductase subunit M n=1 Tax=Paenibacillus beijingensis TaxID=1126833 RepID=A0A0D5NHE4_9BACL|nr:NADH-quinone oxidoreductase subunit M [Paenibacillus beijingensis]AJY74555.1 NADH:ubiquinone oxidoreductase subunit M [Paenibacillus beijingensis]